MSAGNSSLDQYDCIGFDLDNTLVEYKEYELVSLIYNISASYLVNHKEYDAEDILKPISQDLNFLRKGLTIDMERGNVVSIGEDGTILRASHGTQLLSVEDIGKIYGTDRKWDLAVEHCRDFLVTWNGELSCKIRSFLDYFDMSVPLLFARIVDAVDRKNLHAKSPHKYDIWSHIHEAVMYVYKTETFIDNSGEYYREVKANPSKYLEKCSSEFLDWLKSLKAAGKITFLITGSRHDYASYIAEYCLTKNWQEYFDVIVYYAKKPGFFVQNRQFLTSDSSNVIDIDLYTEKCYTEGNWPLLRKQFSDLLGKSNPKSLYIGDNLIQDIFAPAHYECCDTIAVAKEFLFEKQKKDLFSSTIWGSFFFDDENKKLTVWGKIIQTYSKFCIPSINWFVNESLQEKCNQINF